jgi:hypothetical protein
MKFFFFCLWITSLVGEIHHHPVDSPLETYEWEVSGVAPFEQLIVSWNAVRPQAGKFTIFVSLQVGEWSPWLPYAVWEAGSQHGFTGKEWNIAVDLNAVNAVGAQADGFRIRVEARKGAEMKDFRALHACTSIPSDIVTPAYFTAPPLCLEVKGLSQKPRQGSPTSTAAVVRYLTGDNSLDPALFAERCRDRRFDVFGNWTLNVAAAYHELRETPYWCWVQRLDGFEPILDALEKGFPTVISVSAPLPGSTGAYPLGHLIAVIGFDPQKQQVLCMDPAFSTNEKTLVRYDLNDLLEAWARQQYISYVFGVKS